MTGLTTPSTAYKPFRYPRAYDYWKKQQQVHWLPDEVPLADDVADFHKNLSPAEVNLLTHIFRFFTQSDVEVNDCYHRHYLNTFKPTEIAMMLTSFSNMETIHIAAYSHLLDTIGMDEVEYSAFMDYEAMKAKHDYLQQFNADTPYDVAKTMAVFGGFTEGLQLFASFAILLNFPRFNKMKGMGQIVTWSVRDESLHCEGIIWLFHQWCREHSIDLKRLGVELADICREVVQLEDAFIDLAFEMGEIEGLSATEVKAYIRFIANHRMSQLGFAPVFEGVEKHPLPWLKEILNGVEHANFFEARATEYSRAATKGAWTDVWNEVDGEVGGAANQ